MIETFCDMGHEMTVAAVGIHAEKPGQHPEKYCRVLAVKTRPLQKTGKYRKVLFSFFAGLQLAHAVFRNFKREPVDLIIFSTPPITLLPGVLLIKRHLKAPLYLLLKDIWPDDTVGIGGMREGGIVWRVFRFLANRTYRAADFIGCMSEASVRYLRLHYPELPSEKVEVCPNSRKSRERLPVDRQTVRRQYGIPDSALVIIYGGNLGKAQGIEFLIDIAIAYRNDLTAFFLIVGTGTEVLALKRGLLTADAPNVRLLPALPSPDYEALAASCDVGLVLLHPLGRVPNFPSRLLSYLMAGLPVIVAADDATDMGDIVERHQCGFKCRNGDLSRFKQVVEALKDEKKRLDMGRQSYRLFKTHYTTAVSCAAILRHFGASVKEESHDA
ncbi:glycosyltransferase family 4 protein [Oscillospiraceae bacterium WX1]